MTNPLVLGLGPTNRPAASAACWLTTYGLLQAWWAAGHRPAFGPIGTDLVTVSGWAAAALCLAGAALALGLARPRQPSRPRRWAALTVAAGLAAASALLLLDVVWLLIPGLGPGVDPVAAASRAACLTGALLLVGAVWADRRRWSSCPGCAGISWHWPDLRWARYGAMAAILGCAVRIGAQLVVGFEMVPFEAGPAVVVFEAGFLLAGVALPLALVSGRALRARRRVLAVPAAAISAGMICYFGTGLARPAARRDPHRRYRRRRRAPRVPRRRDGRLPAVGSRARDRHARARPADPYAVPPVWPVSRRVPGRRR